MRDLVGVMPFGYVGCNWHLPPAALLFFDKKHGKIVLPSLFNTLYQAAQKIKTRRKAAPATHLFFLASRLEFRVRPPFHFEHQAIF